MNSKIIHLCCCKPPSSWYCIIADPGSLDRWRLKHNFVCTHVHLLVTHTTLKCDILSCFEGRLSQARLSFSLFLRTGSIYSIRKSWGGPSRLIGISTSPLICVCVCVWFPLATAGRPLSRRTSPAWAANSPTTALPVLTFAGARPVFSC